MNNRIDTSFEFSAIPSCESSIVDRFNTIVHQYATRLAIQDTSASITYAQLAAFVSSIAAATFAATQGRCGPVAILLRNDASFPAAMLGALAAGRAYVPLDVEFPIERNGMIIGDAGACAIISTSHLVRETRQWLPRDLPIIEIDNLQKHQILDQTRIDSDEIAAIYYTSGSTGRPKGVAWTHRNLLHWVQVSSDAAKISCTDRLALLISPSISGSYYSIYNALLSGASLHILPPLELGLPALFKQMHRRNITIVNSVPTLVARLAEQAHERLDTVRFARIGGHRILWRDVDACRRIFSPDICVCSVLSSTEAGPFIQGVNDDAVRGEVTHPPVGRPTQGWSISIAGEDGQAVPVGEIGEIVVTSRFLALGYWRGGELQAESFSVDPIDPRLRIYRTGDLASQRADGTIEYVGRKDDQIKLRGYRIETGEIEFVLKDCSGVEAAAVVVRRNEAGLPLSLAAYVEPQRGVEDLTPHKLLTVLNRRVPGYMVPATIVVVDNLPRLPNLKIDREELRRRDQLESRRPLASAASGGAPGTQVQEKLLSLWRAVLNRQDIGPDDDFFLCGGDSLTAVDLFHRIEIELQYKLPLTALTEAPTVNLLCACLEAAARGQVSNTVRVNAAGRQPPLFVVHGVRGHTLGLLPAMRSLGPDQPVFGLQPPKMDWATVGCTTVPEAAAHFIGEVKAVQPHGPYRLLGTSFGGLVVFEMALQLQNLGEPVEYLALVDVNPPTCILDNGVDSLMGHPAPSRQQAGPIEGLHLRVYETHIRMASAYVLDSRLNQNVFRGELTYFCCTGNPIVAHDRRRLWQHFASPFRLILLAGPHDVATPGSDQTAFHELLRASLNGEVQTGSKPETVFDRSYQMGHRAGAEYILGSMGDVYRVEQNRLQGNIDGVFIEEETIQFKGWAVEPCRRQRAKKIAVFLDEHYLGYGATGERRADVMDKLAVPSVLHAGFNFHFRRNSIPDVARRPRVFVLSNDGTAAELTSAHWLVRALKAATPNMLKSPLRRMMSVARLEKAMKILRCRR